MLTLKALSLIQRILATCSTIYSSGNHYEFFLSNQTIAYSERPWTLLETMATPPGNCVNLVLGSCVEYYKSLTTVNQSRFEVKIVLFHTNISYIQMDIGKYPPSYEVNLIQLDNGTIKYHYSYTPFGPDGKAVSRHVTASHTIIRPHIIRQEPYPEGSDVDIMRELSTRLGFNVSYTPATSFSHVVHLIADGKADMSVSNAAADLQRYRLGIDFFALIHRRYVFVYRHPIPIQPMYTVTLPFTLEVWCAILTSVIGIMLTLALLNKCYGSKDWLQLSDMSLSYVPLISASVPHTWYNSHVNKAPYYIIHFTWLLLGTVLSLSYSSNLLANLVKVELEFQPQTLQDVLNMETGVYVLKNSVMPQYLEESPLELQQRIYKEAVTTRGGYYNGSVMPPQEIIDKIINNHDMALLTGDSEAAFRHKFSMVKEEANSGPCGYYFRPNLPIKNELLKALMRFKDTGIIQKITSTTNWKLSMPWRELQRTKIDNHPVVIGPSHFVPLVILLSVGVGLGLISTLFEIEILGMSQHARADLNLVKKLVPSIARFLQEAISYLCDECKVICVMIRDICKKINDVIVIPVEEDGSSQEIEEDGSSQEIEEDRIQELT